MNKILDAILIVDTYVSRGQDVAALLRTKAKQVLVLDPDDYMEVAGPLLHDQKDIATIANMGALESGIFVHLLKLEGEVGKGSRRLIHSCLSGNRIRRVLKEMGLSPDLFRHVPFSHEHPNGSLDKIIPLFD